MPNESKPQAVRLALGYRCITSDQALFAHVVSRDGDGQAASMLANDHRSEFFCHSTKYTPKLYLKAIAYTTFLCWNYLIIKKKAATFQY